MIAAVQIPVVGSAKDSQHTTNKVTTRLPQCKPVVSHRHVSGDTRLGCTLHIRRICPTILGLHQIIAGVNCAAFAGVVKSARSIMAHLYGLAVNPQLDDAVDVERPPPFRVVIPYNGAL